jgi:acetyltransferase-like isoleucine patch superfamily enzyme
MIDLEKNIFKFVNEESSIISKRMKRFLAMYFPNAEIRRRFWMATNVILGKGTYLNPNVTIMDDYMSEDILLEIGENCSIASGVVFAPYSKHNNSKILRELNILDQYEKVEKILVGNDVWIGANCTIIAGAKIGNCCIIGANSMVNKTIPDYSLAYGNPVRVIKDLRK